MQSTKYTCPRCGSIVQIDQAMPSWVKCPRCSVYFTVSPNEVSELTSAHRRRTAYPIATPYTPPPGQSAGRIPSSPGKQPAQAEAGAARSSASLLPRASRTLITSAGLIIAGGVALAAWCVCGPKHGEQSEASKPRSTIVASEPNALPTGKQLKPKTQQPLPPLEENPLSNPQESSPSKPSGPFPATELPKVTQAIDRGVVYLKKVMFSGDLYSVYPGANTGATALAGLTLLECGVLPSDAAVTKAADVVREESGRLTFTYSLSLAIMFLDRRGSTEDRDLIRSMALRLIASQSRWGGWGYHCSLLTSKQEQDLLNSLKSQTFKPGNLAVAIDDNSNVQFAVLALWIARKYEISVDASLAAAENRFRTTQKEDGSWGYFLNMSPNVLHHSTTCAGLLSLATGRGIKEGQKKAKNPSATSSEPNRIQDEDDLVMRRGLLFLSQTIGTATILPEIERTSRSRDTAELARLSKQLSMNTPLGQEISSRMSSAKPDELKLLQQLNQVAHSPTMWSGGLLGHDAWGDLYFCWSIERVAVICNLNKLGGKDWYAWGSELILSSQLPDGSWRERFPGVPDTCFALLFLKRANVAKDLTNTLRAAVPGLIRAENAQLSAGPEPKHSRPDK